MRQSRLDTIVSRIAGGLSGPPFLMRMRMGVRARDNNMVCRWTHEAQTPLESRQRHSAPHSNEKTMNDVTWNVFPLILLNLSWRDCTP